MRLGLVLLATAVAAEICPFCVKEKAKSEVTPGLCTRTQIGWRTYYDVSGTLRDDDPNYSMCDFECSRGHRYNRKIGPGNKVGAANIVDFQPPSLAPPAQRARPAAIRPLTCTIDSIKFQGAKMAFMDCRRGNCNGKPLDLTAMMERLFESIECR